MDGAVVSSIYYPVEKENEKDVGNKGDEGHRKEENVVPHRIDR